MLDVGNFGLSTGEVICDICITLLVMGIFTVLLIWTFWHSSDWLVNDGVTSREVNLG